MRKVARVPSQSCERKAEIRELNDYFLGGMKLPVPGGGAGAGVDFLHRGKGSLAAEGEAGVESGFVGEEDFNFVIGDDWLRVIASRGGVMSGFLLFKASQD